MTGATGAVLAIRLLQVLQEVGVETHLILSKWAIATLKYETDMTASDVSLFSSETLVLNLTWLMTCCGELNEQIRDLATVNHNINDMAAAPSSGSFLHDGMIVIPCAFKPISLSTLGGKAADLASLAAQAR